MSKIAPAAAAPAAAAPAAPHNPNLFPPPLDPLLKETTMRVMPVVVVAAGLLLGLAGCTNPYDPAQRFVGGGLLGAGAGAAIGAAAGGGRGAALGAAIGGATGALGGLATTPPPPPPPQGYYGPPGYYPPPGYAYPYPYDYYSRPYGY